MNDEIEIILLSVIHQNYQDLEIEINELNKKLENLCKGTGMCFIDGSNIKGSSLNKRKIYLNESGTTLFTKKIVKGVNFDLSYKNIDEYVRNLTKDSSFIISSVSHLSNLRSKNS